MGSAVHSRVSSADYLFVVFDEALGLESIEYGFQKIVVIGFALGLVAKEAFHPHGISPWLRRLFLFEPFSELTLVLQRLIRMSL